MLKYFTLSISFIFICITTGLSQNTFKKGFLVFAIGDTLHGLLEDRVDIRNAQEVMFKQTETADKKLYFPTDLSAYQVGSRTYLSTNVKQNGQPQNLFLEVINDGPLRLLYYKDIDDKQHFYAQTATEFHELTNERKTVDQNGKTFSFYTKAHVTILNTLTADCGEPATEKLNFTMKALSAHVAAYNACRGGLSYASAKATTKPTFSQSVFVGINQSQVVTAGAARFQETNTRTGLNAGAGIHLNFPNRKYHVDLLAEYNRKGAEAEAERINFDLHYISLSPGFSYTFSKSRFKPLLGAGFVAAYLLNSPEEAYTRMRLGKKVRIFDNMVENSEVPYEVGYEVRAGVKYALQNDLQLLVKARFTRTLIPFSFGASTYHNHVASVQVGLEF
ncbi:PorT family protein [Pontibacter qinzhouensis]|uniref:PorT family protein n=1 Tax=Pontibacter qinzhouensis TaxID=2603253 RepID=A0A5C8K8C4_9BACT|nr:outer membrane beta-barrel protein [Pontibacter qinzhouensis]TXK47959.1 PorT family protein [Pontibacter qinzhouensis]